MAGPQNPTEKAGYWGDLFGELLSRNNVFEIFMPFNPLKYLIEKVKQIDSLHFGVPNDYERE